MPLPRRFNKNGAGYQAIGQPPKDATPPERQCNLSRLSYGFIITETTSSKR